MTELQAGAGLAAAAIEPAFNSAEFPSDPLFDAEFYRALYPDVDHSGMDAFEHYRCIGSVEERRPHRLFDPAHWRGSLAAMGVHLDGPACLATYRCSRQTWLAAPHYLFDPVYYLRQAEMQGLVIEADPLSHYVWGAGRTGLDPHPLFDSRFYLEQLGDGADPAVIPLEHYLELGHREGLEPNPLFSGRYYRPRCPELRGSKEDALKHYIERGGAELRDPHPCFEAHLYAAHHPDCLDASETPLGHYARRWLERGVRFPPWGTRLAERFGHERDADRIDAVLVSHELSLTGAPRILLRIAEHLVRRRGLKLLVLAPSGGPLLEAFREWAPVLVLSELGDGAGSAIRHVCAPLSGPNGPRLAIVNTACVPEICQALADAGLPTITLVHELASGFSDEVFEAIYRASRLVIYPAAFVRNEAQAAFHLPAHKSVVLPQGLLDPGFGRADAARARQALLEQIGAPPDAFLVLGCGTLDLRKGIDVFVRVAAAAKSSPRRSARPLHFIWMGGGDDRPHSPFWYAREDVLRGGLDDCVHFIGTMADPEPVFVGCDAFVVTSRMDPFPCVVHEAMACAKPVIAFENAGGAPEALVDGAGVTVPYGDAAAMARALCDLADDDVAAYKYGRRARAVVGEKYAFCDYVEKILTKVEEVAGVEFAEGAAAVSRENRDRVVFTLPDWRNGAITTFIERLTMRLEARGFATEIIFTGGRPAASDLPRLPRTPYRFMARSFRGRLGFLDRCARLERSLRAAAPAVLVHGLDPVGSAAAPIVPRGVGVLGMLHDDAPDYLEQAARLGRYWQRTVAGTPRTSARLTELFPHLMPRTVTLGRGFPDHGAPGERAADEPLRILCAAPSAGRRDLLHYLRTVVDELSSQPAAFELTIIETDETSEEVVTTFSRDIAAGLVRLSRKRSTESLIELLRASDALIWLEPETFAFEIAEVMSLGVCVLAVTASPGSPSLDEIADGENGYLAPLTRPQLAAQALAALAGDPTLRRRVSEAAYASGCASRVDIEQVCDRYAALLESMCADLDSGRYVTPAPVFLHPALGGLSLPPALQVDPDSLDDDLLGDSMLEAFTSDEEFDHPGWAPVFDLSDAEDGDFGAELAWRRDGAEVLEDGDGGLVVNLPSNASHTLMLRMALESDARGVVTAHSQTIIEPAFMPISRTDIELRRGLNRLKLDVLRDASVRSIRLSPGAVRLRLRRLTVLAPAGGGNLQAPVLRLGRVVDFGVQGEADEYLSGGWYAPETRHRWSHSGDGAIRFAPDPDAEDSARLWVRLRAFGVAVLGPVEVEMTLPDGAPIERWTFEDDGWRLNSLPITRSLADPQGVVGISFLVDQTQPVASLGLGPDTRVLGVALQAMALFPADCSPDDVAAAMTAAHQGAA